MLCSIKDMIQKKVSAIYGKNMESNRLLISEICGKTERRRNNSSQKKYRMSLMTTRVQSFATAQKLEKSESWRMVVLRKKRERLNILVRLLYMGLNARGLLNALSIKKAFGFLYTKTSEYLLRLPDQVTNGKYFMTKELALSGLIVALMYHLVLNATISEGFRR